MQWMLLIVIVITLVFILLTIHETNRANVKLRTLVELMNNTHRHRKG